MTESTTGGSYQPGRGHPTSHGISTSGDRSGEARTPSIVTSGNLATGASGLSFGDVGQSDRPKFRASQLAMNQCNALLSACVADLEKAIDNDDEFFHRCNAISDLKDRMTRLWRLRSQREAPFAEVINTLQTVLAMRETEDVSLSELEHLRDAFEKLRSEPEIRPDLVKEISVQLLKGGVDVFRALR